MPLAGGPPWTVSRRRVLAGALAAAAALAVPGASRAAGKPRITVYKGPT